LWLPKDDVVWEVNLGEDFLAVRKPLFPKCRRRSQKSLHAWIRVSGLKLLAQDRCVENEVEGVGAGKF
jgi:hypothetical protein